MRAPIATSPLLGLTQTLFVVVAVGCGAPLEVRNLAGEGKDLRFRVEFAEFVETPQAAVAILAAREARFYGLVAVNADNDAVRYLSIVLRIPKGSPGDCLVPNPCDATGWGPARWSDWKSTQGLIHVRRLSSARLRIAGTLNVEVLDLTGATTFRQVRWDAADASAEAENLERLLPALRTDRRVGRWLAE